MGLMIEAGRWFFWSGVIALVGVLGVSLAGCAATDADRENVILIVIDALRRDHLSCYGYPRNTSPTIDGLAQGGFFLENVVVHAPQTVPSTVSLLTSRLPYQHGIQYWPRLNAFGHAPGEVPVLDGGLKTIAEYFHDAGYATMAAVANPWLKADHGFAQGFDQYWEDDCRLYGVDFCDGADLNEAAKAFLQEEEHQRSFLYLHYMDVHSPYVGNPDVEPAFRLAEGEYVYKNGLVPDLSSEDLEYTKSRYDEKILYVDGLIRELLDFLKAKESLDDTTIIITSDHGDEFFEHGGLGHGHTLYSELTRSFVILWGSRFPRTSVPSYHAAVDMLPTVLDGFGIEPDTSLEGVSALPRKGEDGSAPEPRAIITEIGPQKAVILEPWKLIMEVQTGRERFFHIGSGGAIETEEQVPPPDVARQMREIVEDVLRRAKKDFESAPADARTLMRLRALGYLE